MRCCSFSLVAILSICFILSLHASIIHVPADSPTIQGGIDAAVDGDTVMVSPGTYSEHAVDFLGKAITVTGTDPVDSAVVAVTVVDAGYDGLVFKFTSGEDRTSVLSGMTVTGGKRYIYGGGILCNDNSSPTITHNIITGNRVFGNGAGIACLNGSSPAITHNIITNNMGGNDGGGIFLHDGSSAEISYNVIASNVAYEEGGGGIFCRESAPVVSNNLIADNKSLAFGAGIDCDWFSSMTITNNVIVGNQTLDGEGGGIRCQGSTAVIVNNLIAGNFGSHEGGGISCDRTAATILNNTITGNTTDGQGGGIYCRDSSYVEIANSILWDNDGPLGEEIYIGRTWNPSTVAVNYSDVGGHETRIFVEDGCTLNWGVGNLDADPRFAPFYGFDFLLHPSSPCVDAGDPSIEDGISDWHPRWPGWYPNGSRSDMGAFGGPGNAGWLPLSR